MLFDGDVGGARPRPDVDRPAAVHRHQAVPRRGSRRSIDGDRPEGRGHHRDRHASTASTLVGRGDGVRLHRRQHGRGGRREDHARRSSARSTERLPVIIVSLLGRRAHDGRRAVADADGEDQRGARAARSRAAAVHLGADRSDDRRRHRELRDARRPEHRRAEGADRLRRAARDRADDPAEAARGLPAQRVPARARHARPGRRSARDEGRRSRASLRFGGARQRPSRADAGAGRRRSPPSRRLDDEPRTSERRPARLPVQPRDSSASSSASRTSPRLLRRARPSRAQPSRRVHIAGTNGKGSVTAMVDAALRAAGHRTARYTSPHLDRLEERFVIDGAEVDDRRDCARPSPTCATAVERLLADGVLTAPPTFFEATTAVAFELFRARRRRDRGARGRARRPARRHQRRRAGRRRRSRRSTSITRQHLGDTLAAIAVEKAGIIKPGVPVVIGPPAAGGRSGSSTARAAESGRAASSGRATQSPLPLGARAARCPARHQQHNARVVAALAATSERTGVRVPDEAIATASRASSGRDGSSASRRGDARSCSTPRTTRPAPVRSPQYCDDAGWTDADADLRRDGGQGRRRHARAAATPGRRIVCTTAPTPRAAARMIWRSTRRASCAPGRARRSIENPARALAHAVPLRPGCRGRLDVSDRPPAWYSSLIPAAAHPRMFRLSLSFLLCVLCHWALVPAPRARPDHHRRLQARTHCRARSTDPA